MITMLKEWKGAVEVNNERYDNITAVILRNKPLSGQICIKLYPQALQSEFTASKSVTDGNKEETSTQYRVTVRQYMTKPTENGSDFDFMLKWNNNVPMPLRTMVGTVEKETKGMYKMHLKGFGEQTCTCMRCGKELKNPVSRYYGIGPECMAKLGLVREIDDVEGIKEDLQEVEWTGWVIKSAITEMEEVK